MMRLREVVKGDLEIENFSQHSVRRSIGRRRGGRRVGGDG